MKSKTNDFPHETTKERVIVCKSCGSPEFQRITHEEGTIVRLVESDTTFRDEIIREGESSFVYRCTKCEAELSGA